MKKPPIFVNREPNEVAYIEYTFEKLLLVMFEKKREEIHILNVPVHNEEKYEVHLRIGSLPEPSNMIINYEISEDGPEWYISIFLSCIPDFFNIVHLCRGYIHYTENLPSPPPKETYDTDNRCVQWFSEWSEFIGTDAVSHITSSIVEED